MRNIANKSVLERVEALSMPTYTDKVIHKYIKPLVIL